MGRSANDQSTDATWIVIGSSMDGAAFHCH